MNINNFLSMIGHQSLLKLPPETAHSIGIWAMKKGYFAPGKYTSKTPVKLFDKNILNPFGLAAGFDKYAQLHDVIQNYGFGWIESGSFTHLGGTGNPKPRLFRLPKEKALRNFMGLNCISAVEAAEIFTKAQNPFSYAVSIAKSHIVGKSAKQLTGDNGIRDIVESYKLLFNFGLYTMINISCPNTVDRKTFEVEPKMLLELLSELDTIRKSRKFSSKKARPLLLKLSPCLDEKTLKEIIEVSDEYVDGYQAVNTLSDSQHKYGKGGLSGHPLKTFSLETTGMIKKYAPQKVILGCGGIESGKDIKNSEESGAQAFLAYTGFVYGGSRFAHRCLNEYYQL